MDARDFTGSIPRVAALIAALFAIVPLFSPAAAETSEEAMARIVSERRVINVHEHVQDRDAAERLREAMDATGIRKTVLVGSSWFTISLWERVGFTRYDENNDEILRIAQDAPDRFQAWPTVNPHDPDKLEKVKELHARGAHGVKLYTGHGYVRRDTGNYMFHTMALDDPSMYPLYEFWQENLVPICFHVNPALPGFAQQLIAVLTDFPDMKVIAPHFMLSTIRDDRLREFLDAFPNLYSDISFGHDDFMRDGLLRISRNPGKFRDLFTRYPERFMFGTDLVFTHFQPRGLEWTKTRIETYYDMLSKREYATPLAPGQTLRGLALPPELLENIFFRNFERFVEKRPADTEITREINWDRMGVDPRDREPGQTFPPLPRWRRR